jgi:hypothetical protein
VCAGIIARHAANSYELLVEAEQTEQLWQKWEQPEMWRLARPGPPLQKLAVRGEESSWVVDYA